MQTSVLERTSAFDAAPMLARTRSGGGTDFGCDWFGAMHDPQLCTMSVKGISRLNLRPRKYFVNIFVVDEEGEGESSKAN